MQKFQTTCRVVFSVVVVVVVVVVVEEEVYVTTVYSIYIVQRKNKGKISTAYFCKRTKRIRKMLMLVAMSSYIPTEICRINRSNTDIIK